MMTEEEVDRIMEIAAREALERCMKLIEREHALLSGKVPLPKPRPMRIPLIYPPTEKT